MKQQYKLLWVDSVGLRLKNYLRQLKIFHLFPGSTLKVVDNII